MPGEREPNMGPSPLQPIPFSVIGDRIRGSESLLGLIPALIAARTAMPPVVKDKQNPHFHSRYADLASIREASAGPLRDNGLCILQSTHWTFGELFLNTSLIHTSGEWIGFDYPVFAEYGNPQRIGAALTYARRFAMQTILDIAPEDDDGETAVGRGPDRARQGAQRPRHDDRGQRRDDRTPSRQDVNREFANGSQGGREDAPRESWHEFITGWLRRTNRLWVLEMTKEGVPPDRRKEWAELSNEPRVVNHLVSRLLELDQIETADVGKDGNPTVRDPDKSRKVVEDFFARKPQSIQKAVAKYLDGKRGEARAKLGMPDPESEDRPTPPETVPGRGDAYEGEQPKPSSN